MSLSSRKSSSVQARRCRGVVVPLVAVILPVIMIMAAFTVNLSYMELTRTELRISADAATRAAGRTFVNTNSQAQARASARLAATRNQVAGGALQLSDSDIEFGTSARNSIANRYSFAPGGSNANAVRVTARRDAGSLSGVVNMIFPSSGGAANFSTAQSAVSSPVELDVALVLDRSGSMVFGADEQAATMVAAGQPPASAPAGWQFCDPAPPDSRWRELLNGVAVFNSVLSNSYSNEQVALVTYSSSSTRDLNLTSDFNAVLTAMDTYSQSLCSGATNIGSGIYEAMNTLDANGYARPWAAKVIVVMTDGNHNTGSNPEWAASDAFDAGITVYSITFSNEADQSRMKQVAINGGGKHFHAEDGAALQQAFTDIARSLPTLLTD